jgi:hypothetical protein
VVSRLAEKRVDEVGASERTSDERRARSSGRLNTNTVSDVTVDLRVTETEETQLAPVRVGREVLESVKKGSKKTVSFVCRRFAATVTSAPSEFDALEDALADELRGGLPPALLVGNVVLYEGRSQ